MGSQESKLEQPPQQNENFKNSSGDSVPSTPILTPVDPRSPSANIARTPLELVLGSQTIEDSPNVLEESAEGVVEDVVLGIDPRSPTVEFNRTPIIVSTVTKEKPLKLQNKNLDNVRKSLIQTTPVTSVRKSIIVIPPKLIGSTTLISTVPSSNKRKSLVGLLETNIDFTETDLDSVYQAKINLNKSIPLEEGDNENLDNQMDALQINSEEIVDDKSDLIEEDKTDNFQKELEFVEDTDKTVEEKTINVTAHVKDFDKKLTNLIYQDDSEDDAKFSVKFGKIRDNNRTPLGVRNSNEEPKKPTCRLKVSDKPRKSETSKIPVFKDNHNRKIGIQCENTPPRKMEEKKLKPKIPQWDADKTLII